MNRCSQTPDPFFSEAGLFKWEMVKSYVVWAQTKGRYSIVKNGHDPVKTARNGAVRC